MFLIFRYQVDYYCTMDPVYYIVTFSVPYISTESENNMRLEQRVLQ